MWSIPIISPQQLSDRFSPPNKEKIIDIQLLLCRYLFSPTKKKKLYINILTTSSDSYLLVCCYNFYGTNENNLMHPQFLRPNLI